MVVIVEVTKEYIYAKDNKSYYQIKRDILPFKLRVGYQLKLIKDEDGNVVDALLINTKGYQIKRTKSKRILNLQAIYSLILGVIIMLVVISQNNTDENFVYLVYWTSILLITLSVIALVTKHIKRLFIIAVISTIIYSIFIFLGISVVLIKANMLGLILSLVGLVPTLINIIYFKLNKKEKTPEQRYFPFN